MLNEPNKKFLKYSIKNEVNANKKRKIIINLSSLLEGIVNIKILH